MRIEACRVIVARTVDRHQTHQKQAGDQPKQGLIQCLESLVNQLGDRPPAGGDPLVFGMQLIHGSVRPLAACSTNRKSKTFRAIGAAAAAPKPPFSTTIAMATLGSSMGAKAMNNE